MRKHTVIFFSIISIMAILGCIIFSEIDRFREDVASKCFYSSKNETERISERHNYFFYLDEKNNIWSWQCQDAYFHNSTPEDIIKQPQIIMKNVDLQSEGYFLKTDKTLWDDDFDYENNTFVIKKIADDIKQFEGKTAINENGDLLIFELRKSQFEYESLDRPITILRNIEYVNTIYEDNNFAIDKNGALWSWGYQNENTLGQGKNATWSTEPKKILDNVDYIIRSQESANEATIYALKNDDTLWAWGDNEYGSVGNGTTEDINYPVKIMENVKAITASSRYDFSKSSFDTFAYALKNDGTLWSWGSNFYGYTGSGTENYVSSPVKILDNVAEIVMDNRMNISFALKNDGSLWGWGSNEYAKLGTGNFDPVFTPIKIMDNVKYCIPTFYNTYILKNDNTLWGSGLSLSYIPSNSDRSTFKFNKILENVERLEHVYNFTFAIKKDKSLHLCGYDTDIERIPPSVNRKKIMDNVKWIDGTGKNIFVMTNNDELFCFVIDEYEKWKISASAPYKLELKNDIS